jgi:hypothetical protein
MRFVIKRWFNVNVKGMAEGTAAVNAGTIERLHGVLRPFLLR